MNTKELLKVKIVNTVIKSANLLRDVKVDFYLPTAYSAASLPLLLINDGQDLPKMPFDQILENLYAERLLKPMLCVGIYCGDDRRMEYGVANQPDYLGRGAKANLYNDFIFDELLPYIFKNYTINNNEKIGYAGFSLGGLCALDIVWHHPDIFSRAGIFSGSLWWRDLDQDDPAYDDDKNRIMQQIIRKDNFKPGLKFFFQCGLMDEKKDRNNNGVIDAVDDTRDHVRELIQKSYTLEDVAYMELDDGKHDVPSWAKAFPAFLKWGWGSY